jgi:hypothetical protein
MVYNLYQFIVYQIIVLHYSAKHYTFKKLLANEANNVKTTVWV